MAPTREELETALNKAGYLITTQRKVILDYLSSTDSHPSVRQILENAKKRLPSLSLATVYNTVQTLSNMGLIKVLDFQSMNNRHETNLSPHINLICTACGKIEDFEEGAAIHADRVKKQCGFEVKDFRLEYYGTCVDCRTQSKNARETNSG